MTNGAVSSVGDTRGHRLIRAGLVPTFLALGGPSLTLTPSTSKEEDLHHEVAVKILHDRYGVSVTRQRFLAERNILARFDRPNIARMFDAGSTPDGRPYLVMERVGGLSIDEHCKSRQLAVLERVQIFRRVCSAVAYAHKNLVVHRDLSSGTRAQGEILALVHLIQQARASPAGGRSGASERSQRGVSPPGSRWLDRTRPDG